MKIKNHVIRGDDEMLRRLKSEYDFIGRESKIEDGKLIVFALPQKKLKPKPKVESEKQTKTERNYGYTRK